MKTKETKEYWWDKKQVLLKLLKHLRIEGKMDAPPPNTTRSFSVTLSRTPSIDIWERTKLQEDYGFMSTGHRSIYLTLDQICEIVINEKQAEIMQLEEMGFKKRITSGRHGLRIILTKESNGSTLDTND